jgi:hypothetical protein
MEALQALNETVYPYLVGDGSRAWGSRVKPTEVAASGIAYPYLSFFYVAGGAEKQTQGRTARLRMTFKGVCGQGEGISDPYLTALQMQGAIADLLIDTGSQDVNPVFPTHAEWAFLTISQDRMIYQAIQLSDSKWSYHAGHQYEFLMERK